MMARKRTQYTLKICLTQRINDFFACFERIFRGDFRIAIIELSVCVIHTLQQVYATNKSQLPTQMQSCLLYARLSPFQFVMLFDQFEENRCSIVVSFSQRVMHINSDHFLSLRYARFVISLQVLKRHLRFFLHAFSSLHVATFYYEIYN